MRSAQRRIIFLVRLLTEHQVHWCQGLLRLSAGNKKLLQVQRGHRDNPRGDDVLVEKVRLTTTRARWTRNAIPLRWTRNTISVTVGSAVPSMAW